MFANRTFWFCAYDRTENESDRITTPAEMAAVFSRSRRVMPDAIDSFLRIKANGRRTPYRARHTVST